MKPIILPDNVNYIGVFLTLRCNLKCPYCINKIGEFKVQDELSASDWKKGLSRIRTREDLPITLQGGEPTIHRDFYEIVNGTWKHMDLLTNGLFDVKEFMKKIPPSTFNRRAKYASIRFSFHEDTNPYALATKVWTLQNNGYNVGIWGLDSNDNSEIKSLCKWFNLDYREKQYLDREHGTYKYPDAITGGARKVLCKPSELLISPSGYIFRCHADLYANRVPVGHILEPFTFPDYKSCDVAGSCNPCDIKLKTDRFQEFGHCSVEIKEIDG